MNNGHSFTRRAVTYRFRSSYLKLCSRYKNTINPSEKIASEAMFSLFSAIDESHTSSTCHNCGEKVKPNDRCKYCGNMIKEISIPPSSLL
ncbi:MAG: hypothetical protein ACOC35_16360 [Promethearchaeia archaeon]